MQQKEIISKIIPVLVGAAFLALVVMAVMVQWKGAPVDESTQIVQDITKLKAVIEQINHDATIIGFDHQQNWINFLQIKKGGFVGSEVGSINLAHPDKWNGPYMDDNPTIQNKEYMVVRTKQGYFITPGQGVTLPNGKTIGKDIILDEDADIAGMMFDKNALRYDDKQLAASLAIGSEVVREQASELLPQD